MVLTNHAEAAVFCELAHSTVAPEARRAAAAQVAAAVAECKQGGVLPRPLRTPHSGLEAESHRCRRGKRVRSISSAPVAAVDMPTSSRPEAAGAQALEAAARTAPPARELPAARSAGASRARPPRSGAPGAATPRSDPAAARAAAG